MPRVKGRWFNCALAKEGGRLASRRRRSSIAGLGATRAWATLSLMSASKSASTAFLIVTVIHPTSRLLEENKLPLLRTRG
jgi:hypothetical protein